MGNGLKTFTILIIIIAIYWVILVKETKERVPHVQFDLIPKPVLDAFHGNKGGTKKTAPVDYKDRIGSHLYSTLMDFQKEGIE